MDIAGRRACEPITVVLAIASRAEYTKHSVHSFTSRVFYHLHLSSLESYSTRNHRIADFIVFIRPIQVNGNSEQERERQRERRHCAFLCL